MNRPDQILPGTGRGTAERSEVVKGAPSVPPSARHLPVPGRNSALNVRDQFPAIVNWHYLDSAATAQKPRQVIDAITQAYSRDYATVHRGVYERSASMTASYEASRAAASNLIGGQPGELIFTRGATEAINLVARTLPKNGRKSFHSRSLKESS